MTMKTMNSMLIAACLLLWGCETKTKTVDSCGDGFLDPGEACDKNEMSVTTCQDLGFYEQLAALSCREDCTIEVSSCNGRCGDRVIQLMFGEQCDGENLVLTTNFCRARGYYGGAEGCNPECMLDESLCLENGSCGDGAWQEAYESCEGVELGGAGCESLGYSGGTLTCGNTCRFDVSGCDGGETCGDEAVNGPEQCDGTNLNGLTCADLEGFAGGVLSCGPDCRLDMSRCHPETLCGDGVVYGNEQCDGENLMGVTCAVLGLGVGGLACGADCRFDADGCSVQGSCGDGLILAGEVCDGDNLDGKTCGSLGYSLRGAALGCTLSCQWDTSACVPKGANADLAALTVSDGALTPAFSLTTTSYTVALTLAVESVTVAGTAADAPYATVAVSPGQPMALVEGINAVTVTVTAEDGTQKSYTVTITRSLESPYIGTLPYVPAGTFQRDETATNLSTVSALRMSRHEITRAQWIAVTGWADPSNSSFSSGMNDPVQQLSWYYAIAFCNKLSLLEGLTPVYSVSAVNFTTLAEYQIPTLPDDMWNQATADWNANGYRLPTEMEWMWAAMGADLANPGAVNTTGWSKAFAGSTGTNAIGDYVVFGYESEDPGRTTTSRTDPVGSKLANELGLHDLSGNVWEWVWDWHGTYPSGTVTDYRGTASGTTRVGRGGNWNVGATYCTVAFQYDSEPSFGYDIFLGFRVVRR